MAFLLFMFWKRQATKCTKYAQRPQSVAQHCVLCEPHRVLCDLAFSKLAPSLVFLRLQVFLKSHTRSGGSPTTQRLREDYFVRALVGDPTGPGSCVEDNLCSVGTPTRARSPTTCKLLALRHDHLFPATFSLTLSPPQSSPGPSCLASPSF
jgi:hypothetical protein